jgi:deoxyribodipyrimidine photo-lyase
MTKQKVSFGFDVILRLEDNIGLFHALESEYPVHYLYDDAILDSLPKMIRELDLFMNHY